LACVSAWSRPWHWSGQLHRHAARPRAVLEHTGANSQHAPSLGTGGQGPAARDNRGVLLPAAHDRRRKAYRAAARQKPAGAGQDPRGHAWAIRYQAEQGDKDGTRLWVGDFNEAGVPAQTSIFVPRHQLAEELRGVIERAFRERGEQITVPILPLAEIGVNRKPFAPAHGPLATSGKARSPPHPHSPAPKVRASRLSGIASNSRSGASNGPRLGKHIAVYDVVRLTANAVQNRDGID
jgi:hypothetical protein